MSETKLVFLGFKTKYLTPNIQPYIKLKLLKSYIKSIEEMPKKYENK